MIPTGAFWLVCALRAAPSEPEDAAPTDTATAGEDHVPSAAAIEREGTLELKSDPTPKRFRPPGSPQRFELDFKLGPYVPNVDRNYSGAGLGPYATIFGPSDSLGNATGQPKPAVMPVFGFEWQFAYLGGPFGLGTQIGFFRDKAQALLDAPMAGESVRSSADAVKFGMVPLSLLAVYRFELLADRFRWVPLVPYAKAGLAYTFWWTRDGNGDISRNSTGKKGRGGVLGWQVNAGAMIRLDFIEPGTAKKLDVTTGINHTYVFGELQVSRVNNFGIGNSIALGDTTWFAGLAMEF